MFLFSALGMAQDPGDNSYWQRLVKWADGSGWQYVDLNWAYDAGSNYKWLPEAGVWIYVFDAEQPAPAPAGFVRIDPGSFIMGSPTSELGRDSDETQHTVILTRAFYLQQTETTKAHWDAVRAEGPARGYTDLPDGGNGFNGDASGTHPVTEVSWHDVLKWLNLKSELEGLTPCYRVGGYIMKIGTLIPVCDFSANGYRLPTESEWEYACRAGTTTAFYSGSITYVGGSPLDPNLDLIGWYSGNGTDHPVGQKQANAWGLYDMSGNVWEWCWDWYGTYPGTVTDPAGPGSGSFRVLRGGSWYNIAQDSRSASRRPYSPDSRFPFYGFRPARTE